MKMTRVKMNKPLYLGMSILDISKILMYEFGTIILYQSMETEQNYAIQILVYADAIQIQFYIKTEDLFEDISNDVEKWFI